MWQDILSQQQKENTIRKGFAFLGSETETEILFATRSTGLPRVLKE